MPFGNRKILIPFFVLLAYITVHCSSDSTPEERVATPGETVTLVGSFADGLTGSTAGCSQDTVKARVIADGAETASAATGPDCSFSVSVPADRAVSITFEKKDGSKLSYLYTNPYIIQPSTRDGFLSLLRVGAGKTLDLGRITIIRDMAFSEFEPQEGLDLDGGLKGLTSSTAGINPIAPAPIHARLTYSLEQVASGSDLASLQANKTFIEAANPNVKITSTGYMRGPLPMRGLWVKVGEKVYTADRDGVVTIDEIPSGVTVAKVYDHLSDSSPLMWLPLGQMTPTSKSPAEIHVKGFQAPSCGMDDQALCQTPLAANASLSAKVSVFTNTPLSAKPLPSFLANDLDACNHDYNESGCCLDYDGPTGSGSRNPGAQQLVDYLGSTCSKYVDEGCCAYEGGDAAFRLWAVAQAVKSTFGGDYKPLYYPKRCYDQNHKFRNCQWIDISSIGLGFYLSATAPTETAKPPTGAPWPLPQPFQTGVTHTESITVPPCTSKPLYLYNNLCSNESYVSFGGAGKLTPTGEVRHYGRAKPHEYAKTLNYTAPDIGPNIARVVALSRGFQRIIEITIPAGSCTATTQPPVTQPTPTPTPPAQPTNPPSVTGSCTGVTHFTSSSEITVCVRFANVAQGTTVNFSMGSATTSATTDSTGKACATFPISAYGSYSGLAGVSTDAGNAVLNWDITVTSAAQACSL